MLSLFIVCRIARNSAAFGRIVPASPTLRILAEISQPCQHLFPFFKKKIREGETRQFRATDRCLAVSRFRTEKRPVVA